MQKKLIALAIAGLSSTAFAQSNVTVSGTIGASYDNYSLSGATTARATYRQTMVSDQSSAIVLSGQEDLGGGMKAWFQIDSRLTMDRGNAGVNNYSTSLQTSGLGNGNTAIGFMGNWGKVGVGRWDLHYDSLAGIENLGIAPALAARFGHFGVMANVGGAAAAAATQIAVGSRSSNVMFYETPTFSGFNGRIAYSTNAYGGEGEANLAAANGDTGNGSSYNIKLNYSNGPLAAVYSYWNHKIEDRGNYTAGWAVVAAGITNTPTAVAAPNPADQNSNRLGVAYTFPMGLKVGLAWDRSTVKSNAATGDRTRTAWMLPISYTMGAHVFAFNYAKAGKTSGSAAGADDNAARQWLLGYAYNLSKRTTVGVQYMRLDNNANAAYSLAGASAANTGLTAQAAGEDSKLVSFNVRHAF